MATSLAFRITTLQTEIVAQRKLIQQQMEQLDKQQAVIDIQFRRMADIQAELDLVKATVRRAATTFAALLIDPQRHTASVSSPPSASFVSAPAF